MSNTIPPGEAAKLDWRKGWSADQLCSSAPRWTLHKSGKSKRTVGVRHTYLDDRIDVTNWVPGAGRYKTDREFLTCKDDELDSNNTIQECAPNYTIPKMLRSTSIPSLGTPGSKDEKAQRTAFPFLPTSHYTPGPGAYTQWSTFGAASGPYRKVYFGTRKADYAKTSASMLAKVLKPPPA